MCEVWRIICALYKKLELVLQTKARQNLHPSGRIAPDVVGGKLLLVKLVVFGLGVTLGPTCASKESSASPAFWEAKGFATHGAAATR